MRNQTDAADKNEITGFWTKVMRGNHAAEDLSEIKVQIKASELLSKHLGMFKESKESEESRSAIEFVGDEHLAD